MDDPVPLPDLLLTRPPDPDFDSNSPKQIHHFDLDLQCVSSLPAFEGVHVLPDFLSIPEADELLEKIEEAPFVAAQSGKLKQHYGPKINFNKQKLNVDSFRGLPSYVPLIESRLLPRTKHDRPGCLSKAPDLRLALESFQTTDAFVMRYRSRDLSNLDFHVDDIFGYGEVILDVSLESDSVLTFINGSHNSEPRVPLECVRVPLPARSIAILHGHARFDWEHAILAYDVCGQRTSLTLRTLSESLRLTDAGRRVFEIARGRGPLRRQEPALG